ncbi:hypothetical protein [Streptomyces sp. PsTaAH-124]|uniref:hypothetical protein n=1 Tax=Streptomyces sp. PsTaAH-124 TaxID=1157638 RepID=UPI00035F0EB2|nr:hypothetical protein [Streptomyces sp. PsTaAH-124]
MDLATLRALRPTRYTDAADGYRAASGMASTARERIDDEIARSLRQSLKGEAATEALGQLQALSGNFHYVQVECGLAATALDAFAHEMTAARRKLEAALEDARAADFTVGADGSVTYPAGGEESGGERPHGGSAAGLTDPTAAALGRQAGALDPNPAHRRAQDIADRIAAALQDATEADEKWAPKLRALKADDDLTVSADDWTDAKKDTEGVLEGAAGYLDSLPHPPAHGTPVNHAADLNIPADRVWAATAKNDLVNLAPPPAGTLAPLNPKAYMRLFDDHSIMYGYDPTSDDFGGQRFKVADGKLPGSDGPMPAHSQYWEGASLTSMAKIATGGTP